MNLLTPAQAYIALLIEYVDEDELLDWARSYASEHPELSSDSPLLEMLRFNRKRREQLPKVRALMETFVAAVEPSFDVLSKQSQENRESFVCHAPQTVSGRELQPLAGL